MTAAQLIEVLMKDENIDKDVVVMGSAGTHEYQITDIEDFSSLVVLRVE